MGVHKQMYSQYKCHFVPDNDWSCATAAAAAESVVAVVVNDDCRMYFFVSAKGTTQVIHSNPTRTEVLINTNRGVRFTKRGVRFL